MKKDNKLNENMGRAFYHLLSTLGNEIIKNDLFGEAVKKDVFKYIVRDYDDLDKEEKEVYNTAGLQSAKAGLEVLTYLTALKNKGG